MSLDPRLLQEIELLLLFDARNPLEGLKVHHEAQPAKIEAAKRLNQLGIITLADGGYLTDRGQVALEHVEALINILQATPLET